MDDQPRLGRHEADDVLLDDGARDAALALARDEGRPASDVVAEALAFHLRLHPAARSAARSLADADDARFGVAMRRVARVLVAAEMDAAMDAVAACIQEADAGDEDAPTDPQPSAGRG